MKTEQRLEARHIRREEGGSMKSIARRLGVSVSSVSLWVRDIELTPKQRLALRNKMSGGQASNAIAARRRRHASQEGGRALVRDSDPLFVAGIMLFWAEGAKARNEAAIVNSDPELVRLFARFLRRFYSVPDERFRVACNLFADHLDRQREIEQFWLDTLELPSSCLRKCKLVVCDTSVVQSIYGAIQEYAGFDRPEWRG